AADAQVRVLDHTDRRFEHRFARPLELLALLEGPPGHQPSRRAVSRRSLDELARLLALLPDELPGISTRVAEPGERTERLRVGQGHLGSFVGHRLLEVRGALG